MERTCLSAWDNGTGLSKPSTITIPRERLREALCNAYEVGWNDHLDGREIMTPTVDSILADLEGEK